MQRYLGIKLHWTCEFLIIFMICILVRGGSIFGTTWNGDDLLYAHSDPASLIDSYLNQLRFWPALETKLALGLGGSIPFQGAFWNVAQIGSMVVFSLSLRDFWAPRSPSANAIAIGLLFILLPYHSHIHSFKIINPFMIACYLSGAYGIHFGQHQGLARASRVAALSVSLGYQTFLSIFLIAGLVQSVLLLAQWQHQGSSLKTHVLRPLLIYFGGLGLAALLSVAVGYIAIKLLGIQLSGRATLASPAQVEEKIVFAKNNLKRYLFGIDYGRDIYSGRLTKILQSSLVLLGIIAIQIQRGGSVPGKLGVAAYTMLAFLVSIIATQIPPLLLSHTGEGPRTLIASSLFPAGMTLLLFGSSSAQLRKASLAAVLTVATSFAILSSSIDALNARSQQRDLLIANRMADALSKVATTNPLRTVIFLGDPNSDAGMGFAADHIKDYVYSLYWPWSRRPLLSEVSGIHYTAPTQQDLISARKAAADRPAWPAPRSVLAVGDVGIIVFADPHRAPAISNSADTAVQSPTPESTNQPRQEAN